MDREGIYILGYIITFVLVQIGENSASQELKPKTPNDMLGLVLFLIVVWPFYLIFILYRIFKESDK